jgi:hypothetical protein
MMVRDLLSLIGDAGAQQRYERDVPIANVPVELVCMWFDDQYHPDAEGFSECFSDEERSLLAGFDEFYDRRVEFLPTSGGVAELHASKPWIEVMEKARATLQALRWGDTAPDGCA